MIEFIWPTVFLLLPLPWLSWRLLRPAQTEQAALRAPFFDSWAELNEQQSRGHGGGRAASALVLTLIWCLLLIAAARPTWIGDSITLPREGRDLLLAVDISGSMQIEDMRSGQNLVPRLNAVKAVIGEFVQRRRGDRLGLILFGTQAYLQAPLTFDSATVKRFLLEAQIGFAGKETAIGDAIGLAVKRLRQRPAQSRILILLTDGANTAGEVSPMGAAALAAENDIRIYTVGVGADEMRVPGIFGSSFGSRVTNPSRDLDEATLQRIADTTGGRYFRARDPAQLAEIYRLLDQLEPVDQTAATYRPRQSLFQWPLAIAMGLSLLLAAARLTGGKGAHR
ncbi:VWA domain-containing protein [Halieaceae bacterium IMCC14734]|uniref:VWA domain-containing protein n=1 Tax=Candidatus Litorirhabdus singularis TaxID=2518993 RepID=A0ABT3TIV6_9GAMM|nr:VWA domain-containing protein [Candidatus Litorirhabdus singularis]MCX2981691.1 VWA domain-containing protein [Candidatus Litorirhabdus singularis]